MFIRLGLLRLVRNLSLDRSERRRLLKASVILLRHRRRSLALLRIFLRRLPTSLHNKLWLWRCLACSDFAVCQLSTSQQMSSELVKAISSTQAYADAASTLARDRNGYFQRGFEYRSLSRFLCEQPPERLLVFHHYDRRGFLPDSWRDALLVFQAAGWQVVISTSNIEPFTSSILEQSGVYIARRLNIGLCVGAYRDLAILFDSLPEVRSRLSSLVFCNDSNLLVVSPEVLLAQLEEWSSVDCEGSSSSSSMPFLSGFTDSFERHSYHLQSYFIHANKPLLDHPEWLRFWLYFNIDGTKDELIDNGEIGLSQSLLASFIRIQPAYPLVRGLLLDENMADELNRYAITQPEHVNQTLFAWRSLLARGFPFIKKHVLFSFLDQQGQHMVLTQLSRLIPEERFDLLARDIEQLMINRYSSVYRHIV